MKITVEDGGQVKSIETDQVIVIAQSDSMRLEVVKGALLELGMLLGSCAIAGKWDMLSKVVAIMRTMEKEEDTTAGKGAIQ